MKKITLDQCVYHGSLVQNLEYIIPIKGKSPDGKKIPRIFAAKDKIYAILNTHLETTDSPDKYIKHGYYTIDGKRGPWTLEELVPNGLDLYKTSGSIYYLYNKYFEDVSEGMIGDEVISYITTKVIKEEKINNIYNELLRIEKTGKLNIKRMS